VAAKDKVIGVVLTLEIEGKEYIITYVGRRLIDAETRYTFIEKLCLSLYYACTKLRHYLFSSIYIVTVKLMLLSICFKSRFCVVESKSEIMHLLNMIWPMNL
jgi:hypothetical protein